MSTLIATLLAKSPSDVARNVLNQVAEKVGATISFDGGGTGRRSGRADVGFLKKADTVKTIDLE